ncbi:MAG TPA: VWA domain-containing protein [Acidobacteriaceae bacterium]|nr:VWA domain-containing protein [Acidobacteriaceae bacterium]
MSFRKRSAQVGLVVWCALEVACAQQAPQDAPPQTGLPTETLHTGTQLVVLDATVLDKAGKVVTQQLGRDDFLIEENKRPQEIRSFESAADHASPVTGGDVQKMPLSIFVLDELNPTNLSVVGEMGDLVYERFELLAYLRAQPAELNGLTEVLVLTHHGYRILVQPTRDRDIVADRVNRHDPGLGSPSRDALEEGQDFMLTRDSMQAMWSLALQQRSVPGRKIVFWLGQGGPNRLLSDPHGPKHLVSSQRHVREITDLLVDARITLYIMGPGGGSGSPGWGNIAEEASSYNFQSDFGFSGYVRATGGQSSNGNDIRGEIQAAATISSVYYTMSYRPTKGDFDGNFRRIKVTVVGHSEWTVLTKAGYYAMQFGGEEDEEHQLQADLSIATFEAMPFSAIGMDLIKIERIKGTDAARFTFQLDSDDLQWHTDTTQGLREADVVVSSAALGSVFKNKALSSQAGTWKLTTPVTSTKEALLTTVTLTAHVPAKTQRLRFVARDMANGRMGSMDLNPAALVGAPDIEPPTPMLQPRTVAAQR